MRITSILERRTSSAPVPLLPALMRSPMSVRRSVTRPAKGSGHTFVALLLLELLYIRSSKYDGSLLRSTPR